MIEEKPDETRARRPSVTLIAAWVVSGIGAAYLVWTTATGPVPRPALHQAVTTALAVGAIVAWLWFIAERAGERRRHDLQQVEARVHDDTAALSRQLYRIESLVGQTGDEATDRIVGVVEMAQAAMEHRVTVLEAAVSQHICRGYADGYADATAGRPPEGVRTKLTAINGRRA